MSQKRIELLERTPQIKDPVQQQIDEQREERFNERIQEIAQQMAEGNEYLANAQSEEERQAVINNIMEGAHQYVLHEMQEQQELLQQNARDAFDLAQQE